MAHLICIPHGALSASEPGEVAAQNRAKAASDSQRGNARLLQKKKHYRKKRPRGGFRITFARMVLRTASSVGWVGAACPSKKGKEGTMSVCAMAPAGGGKRSTLGTARIRMQ